MPRPKGQDRKCHSARICVHYDPRWRDSCWECYEESVSDRGCHRSPGTSIGSVRIAVFHREWIHNVVFPRERPGTRRWPTHLRLHAREYREDRPPDHKDRRNKKRNLPHSSCRSRRTPGLRILESHPFRANSSKGSESAVLRFAGSSK